MSDFLKWKLKQYDWKDLYNECYGTVSNIEEKIILEKSSNRSIITYVGNVGFSSMLEASLSLGYKSNVICVWNKKKHPNFYKHKIVICYE